MRAKTVTSDRDGSRLREEVFMCVCGRRRQGSLAGGWGVMVVGVDVRGRECKECVCVRGGVEGGPSPRRIKWLL